MRKLKAGTAAHSAAKPGTGRIQARTADWEVPFPPALESYAAEASAFQREMSHCMAQSHVIGVRAERIRADLKRLYAEVAPIVERLIEGDLCTTLTRGSYYEVTDVSIHRPGAPLYPRVTTLNVFSPVGRLRKQSEGLDTSRRVSLSSSPRPTPCTPTAGWRGFGRGSGARTMWWARSSLRPVLFRGVTMDFHTMNTWREWISAGLMVLIAVVVTWWADKCDRQ